MEKLDFSIGHNPSRRGVLLGGAALAAMAIPVSSRAATPKRGGRLRAALTGASMSDSFDPALFASEFTSVTGFTIGNCLVEIDKNNKLIPELAESFESSSDLTKWYFKIRGGVEFHNGKTLTPEDVVYSLNHHRGPKSRSALSGVMKAVTDVKADHDTVVVTLAEGNADFPWYLAAQHGIILPAGTVDYTKGIATGAYEVTNFQPGVRLSGRRFKNYWKQNRGNFDEVELLAIADPTARLNALITGSVDAINRINVRAVDRLRQQTDITVLNIVGFHYATMPMRVDIAPFDNLDVRLALKYAMDRQQALERILHGFGTIGNDHPISPIMEFYDKGLPQHAYDPEKARFHLKKAGHSTLDVTLHASEAAFNGAVDTAVLYKEQAAACGISINVQREPDDGYFQRVWLKAPWSMSYWSGRPTADEILTLGYATGASWNECHWSNPRFDALLKAARTEKDQAKRRQMYFEMQQIVHDDDGNLIPFFMNHLYARKSNILSDGEAGNYEMDGYRFTERWWMA